MSLRDGIAEFKGLVNRQLKDTFIACTELIETSVLDGSPLSGTEGVPVATGNAKGSIIPEFVEGEALKWKITATGKGPDGKPAGYVEHIEANVRGVTFANGGPHFFSKTIDAFPRIFEAAKEKAGAA